MYQCDIIGCPEYVSHPGQLCLACTQRKEAEDDPHEDEYEYDEDEGWL